MRALRRAIGWIAGVAILAAMALVGWALMQARPQDLPWTRLDLGQPIGVFTGRKIAALSDDFPQCRALLTRAGVEYTVLPARHEGANCGYDDGVRLTRGGARRVALHPADVGVSCPVAAGLAMWEWDVVQPAAQAIYGSRVVGIDHFGSYSCRRIYGRDSGSWSEHATADAIDIAAFRLANGKRVNVAADWRGDDADSRFLHRVRDGACRLFATVLSPDYNAAHHDHLHLDQAARGALGRRACR
jgi:hypothetical protein